MGTFNYEGRRLSLQGARTFLVAVSFLIVLLNLLFNCLDSAIANDREEGRNTENLFMQLSSPYSDVLLSKTRISTPQDDSVIARVAMFRLYNKYTGEHFYTSSSEEKESLISGGWNDEGIGWYAPSMSTIPVYRLYNKWVPGGDHHYTTDKNEYDDLKVQGWSQEGTGWYSTEEGESDRIPLYRQYNPFATTGTHNYTKSKSENDSLVEEGWKSEGIGWYGYSSPQQSTTEINFSRAQVDTSKKIYTSKQITPNASVQGLHKGTDYIVTYGTNKNAGTGTITIKGIGRYTGSKTYQFTISKLDISNSSVELGDVLTYNATEQTQEVLKIVTNDLTLTEADYLIINNKATNAGSYYLSIEGKGNFCGKLSRKFEIKQRAISFTGLSVADKNYCKDDTSAVINGTAVIEDGCICKDDNIRISSVLGSFIDSNAGNDKAVKLSVELSGDKFENYTIDPRSILLKGNILAKVQLVTNNPKIAEIETLFLKIGDEISGQCSSLLGSRDGLKIEGFYTDEKCTNDTEHKCLTVSENEIKLFTNWIPSTSAYWISPSYRITNGNSKVWERSNDEDADVNVPNAQYVKEQWNVKKSAKEIQEDVAILKEGKGNANYDSTKQEYEAFLESDNFHLYTKWSGATDDESGNDQTGKNAFLEFRIIEVGVHNQDSEGGNDSLTFQMTHVLPNSYKMNSENTNSNGWYSSKLRKSTTSSAYSTDILYNLNGTFGSQMKSVVKKKYAWE